MHNTCFLQAISWYGNKVEKMQNQLKEWNKEIKKQHSLIIHKKKSEVMVVGRDTSLERPIVLNREPFKKVKTFKYVRGDLTSDGRMEQAIWKKGGKMYQSVKYLQRDESVPEKVEKLIYDVYYISMVMYAAES